MGNIDGIIETFIILGVLIGLAIWGCWGLIDWILIDDAIKSSTLIVPEIELIVRNNVIDTLYVYRKP
jgi:hypothetical protein